MSEPETLRALYGRLETTIAIISQWREEPLDKIYALSLNVEVLESGQLIAVALAFGVMADSDNNRRELDAVLGALAMKRVGTF